MYRLLFSLFCLVTAAVLANADPKPERLAWYSDGGGELQSFWVGDVNTPPSIAFQQCTNDSTDGTSFSFATQNTGTAGDNRKTVIGIQNMGGTAPMVFSSVTVGGDAAEQIVSTFGGVQRTKAFFILNNPAGTSETIAVTTNSSVTGLVICTWALYDSDYNFPTSSSLHVGASLTLNLGMDLRTNAVTMGIAGSNNTGGSSTWTGLTERADATTTEGNYSAADVSTTAAEDGRTITDVITAGSQAEGLTITFSDDHAAKVVYLAGCPYTTTGATTYTFTDAPVGIAASDRTTLLGMASEDSLTNFNFDTVTVGGAGATEDEETATSALEEGAIYHIANSVDDQETIAITLSEGTTNLSVCVWAAYGLGSATPNDTTVGTTTNGSAISGNVNTDLGGIVVGHCGMIETTGGSLAGIDSATANYTTIAGLAIASGDEDNTAAEAPRTVTCDPTSGTDDAAFVVGSWD